MLRQPILWMSRNEGLRRALTAAPVTSSLVARFVPGENAQEAIASAARLIETGLQVSLDHLGEDVTQPEETERAVEAYLELLTELGRSGMARQAEVSVKLSALGQGLPEVGGRLSLENVRRICRAARNAGTTVTLDAEDHTTTERTLATLREIRKDFPETGAVLQAYLKRTPGDCRALAYEGSRVRLCKGAYREAEEVAWQRPHDVDRAYVRCLKILMAGQGYPMIATHDPRLISIASAVATRHDRPRGSYEFQMLYGVRPEEQRRLAGTGEKVRVYLPYGREWYGYLMRRLAERPQNMSFFLRALVSQD